MWKFLNAITPITGFMMVVSAILSFAGFFVGSPELSVVSFILFGIFALLFFAGVDIPSGWGGWR